MLLRGNSILQPEPKPRDVWVFSEKPFPNGFVQYFTVYYTVQTEITNPTVINDLYSIVCCNIYKLCQVISKIVKWFSFSNRWLECYARHSLGIEKSFDLFNSYFLNLNPPICCKSVLIALILADPLEWSPGSVR